MMIAMKMKTMILTQAMTAVVAVAVVAAGQAVNPGEVLVV